MSEMNSSSALKKFVIFTAKHLRWSSFYTKVVTLSARSTASDFIIRCLDILIWVL